jgi:hypothetical protein
MARARDLLWFVLLPVALVTGLHALDFPLALPVEPYEDGVTPVYLDRPYVNAAPDPGLAGQRIVRLPRHLRFEVEIGLSAPTRALRLLSDENDNAAFADWEGVDLRLHVDGRSCVLTRAVAKRLAAGIHRLPPGGPVAAAPLLVAGEGEVRARTTRAWNKLTPGAGPLDFVMRNKRKLGLLGLAWAAWCGLLLRLRRRARVGARSEVLS